MPDYEIREWNMTNLPDEILNHQFVNQAIEARKWAYATDVIRLWLLKTMEVYILTWTYMYIDLSTAF